MGAMDRRRLFMILNEVLRPDYVPKPISDGIDATKLPRDERVQVYAARYDRGEMLFPMQQVNEERKESP